MSVSHRSAVAKLVFRQNPQIFPPSSSYCFRCFGRRNVYLALANPNKTFIAYNRIAKIICPRCASEDDYRRALVTLLDREREGGYRPAYTTISRETAMSLTISLA